MNNVRKRYLREIRKLLPCRAAQKKQYLAELNHSIEAFFGEKPDATINELYAKYGSPQAIAETYMEHNSAQITHIVSRKKTLIVIGGLFVICIGILIVVYTKVAADLDAIEDGYYITDIGELPTSYEQPTAIEEY